jgi:hypothetical protein
MKDADARDTAGGSAAAAMDIDATVPRGLPRGLHLPLGREAAQSRRLRPELGCADVHSRSWRGNCEVQQSAPQVASDPVHLHPIPKWRTGIDEDRRSVPEPQDALSVLETQQVDGDTPEPDNDGPRALARHQSGHIEGPAAYGVGAAHSWQDKAMCARRGECPLLADGGAR